MVLADILLHGAAAGSIYFLIAMIMALIHDEPWARAKAWGLGVCLVILMIASLMQPLPERQPGEEPLPRPPRVSGLWEVAPAGANGHAHMLDPAQAGQPVGQPADTASLSLDHQSLEAVVMVQMHVNR